MGYGHAYPMLSTVAKACAAAGLRREAFPNINAIERRIASAIKEPGFGKVAEPEGLKLAAQPRELLRALWPRARKVLSAPMPIHLADEPPLDEAHWPIILSVLASMIVSHTRKDIDPAVALTLIVESALIGSRLDPDLIEPGRWKLGPSRKGLQIAKAEQFRRVA
jgi:hypothetical protein